jgi:L-ascorbate metabolism protein UlaG (beta-lactamase superfamily)
MLVYQKMKSAIMMLTLLVTSNLAFCQTQEIKIKFIGNCGLYLTDGDLDVYVDFPYKSGAFSYMEFDETEVDSIKENAIFLFTHKHADHYSRKYMRKTLRKKGGKKYGKWNIQKLDELNDTIREFSVKAIETEHSLSLKHYAYLITWHGKRIYFYGDTETADIALTMKNLDWAFVPYWTAMEINKRKVEIDTKMLGVYHFYPTMETTNGSPEKVILFTNQGQLVKIPYL